MNESFSDSSKIPIHHLYTNYLFVYIDVTGSGPAGFRDLIVGEQGIDVLARTLVGLACPARALARLYLRIEKSPV